MHPKPPKNNVGLRAKKSPAAPPAYRPQPLPQVLQRKTSPTRAQVQPWAARTVQLAQEGPQQPAVAGGKRKIGGLSPEEAAKRRALKFAADNKASEAEKNKKLQLIETLKEKVRDFERDAADGSVDYDLGPLARKHNYPDPIETFKSEFAEAGWERLEAEQGALGFNITVRMAGGATVTGSYRGRVLTVIHCGKVGGGVGYGTWLGGVD